MIPDQPLSLALLPIDLHWAIEARWAEQARQALDRIDWAAHAREFHEQAEREEAESRSGSSSSADERRYPVEDGLALISISGPMTKRRQSWGRGASTIDVRRQVRQAATDPEVRAIALVIDSPGGQVSGTFDLAADVGKAREKKRVVTYIEDLGASAAYAVASQGDAVFANQNAMVGSIGTYMVVEDLSGMAEKAGVKVHVIRAGEFKGSGEPGTKVTKPQLARWQREVDSLNAVFLETVSRGRQLDLPYVQALADGRLHVAADAELVGLIDGVQSLDAVLSDLRGGRIPARATQPRMG